MELWHLRSSVTLEQIMANLGLVAPRHVPLRPLLHSAGTLIFNQPQRVGKPLGNAIGSSIVREITSRVHLISNTPHP